MIYDVDWWILGKTARLIQQSHPDLDVISCSKLEELIQNIGAAEINRRYSRICALCLGIAAWAIFKNIRIDSSAAVSYYYFSRNYDTLREWKDAILPDPDFLRLVLPRISVIGAMNRKLADTLKALAPHAQVDYIGHFVDTAKFSPASAKLDPSLPLTIGWAGDKRKKSKNYESLYLPVRTYFEHHPRVRFVETSGEYAYDDMPLFYRSIDLLMITSANEGGGATALEAYACGKPVLSTNVGYVKEAAHPDAHPFILDSDDPQDFIHVIRVWMHKRTELEKIGQRCREKIVNEWGTDKAVKRWISLLLTDRS